MSPPLHVRVYTMQRDEGQLLGDWLHHYGPLFDYENLTIFDNGSTDPLTLFYLNEAITRRVRVFKSFHLHHDFISKGQLIRNLATEDMKASAFDFILPVDCDEHLAVVLNDRISKDRLDIVRELERYRGAHMALSIDTSLMNCPKHAGWFSPDSDFVKSFLPAVSIHHIDQGYHACRTRDWPNTCLTTTFTYLHYHNPSFAQAQVKARHKLRYRVDITDRDAMIAYINPLNPGAHLVSVLLMTEPEYHSRYDRAVRINLHAPAEVLLPSGEHIVWDKDDYLFQHPDVAISDWTSPLHHFLKAGHKENRLYAQTLQAKHGYANIQDLPLSLLHPFQLTSCA